MNLKYYLDGAGSINLFPPTSQYRQLDFRRAQAIIEKRIQLEGISIEEAFRKELKAQKRIFFQFMVGQLTMFFLVLAGLLGTLYLAIHHYPWWVALVPHLIGFAGLTAAQIRYNRRVYAGETS